MSKFQTYFEAQIKSRMETKDEQRSRTEGRDKTDKDKLIKIPEGYE